EQEAAAHAADPTRPKGSLRPPMGRADPRGVCPLPSTTLPEHGRCSAREGARALQSPGGGHAGSPPSGTQTNAGIRLGHGVGAAPGAVGRLSGMSFEPAFIDRTVARLPEGEPTFQPTRAAVIRSTG